MLEKTEMAKIKTIQDAERKQAKQGHTHPGEDDIGVKLGHYTERNKLVRVTHWLERTKAKTGQDMESD